MNAALLTLLRRLVRNGNLTVVFSSGEEVILGDGSGKPASIRIIDAEAEAAIVRGEEDQQAEQSVADDDVEAFMLTGLQFEALLRDHPRVGQAILTNIARQLAQRLRVTSEDLRLADS